MPFLSAKEEGRAKGEGFEDVCATSLKNILLWKGMNKVSSFYMRKETGSRMSDHLPGKDKTSAVSAPHTTLCSTAALQQNLLPCPE